MLGFMTNPISDIPRVIENAILHHITEAFATDSLNNLASPIDVGSIFPLITWIEE